MLVRMMWLLKMMEKLLVVNDPIRSFIVSSPYCMENS